MRSVEVTGDAGGGGVAAEAAASFAGVEPAAHGGFEIIGITGVVAGGEIERLQRFVEAEVAFVKAAVAFVDVGLAFVAEAKGPRDVGGERLRAVADGEVDGVARGGEFVVVSGALFGEVGVGLENFGVGGRCRGLGHGSCRLGSGDLRVALRAFGGAYEFVQGGCGLGGPPSGRLDVVFGGE
jgi:hypothetical protein